MRLTASLAGLLGLAALAGCATPPPKTDTGATQAFQEQNDPLEPTNRVSYNITDKIDTYFFAPVARGYRDITTPAIRQHVDNFNTNMGEFSRFVNFVFEGKSRLAGTAMVRFLVNSTVGIGGIFDVAKGLGYQETDTDIGLTLASYGVPQGPYLYVPFFGPSDARDFVNIPAGFILTPTHAPPPSTGLTVFSYSQSALNLVAEREGFLDPIDQIKKTALDPYATFRSLYRQSRVSQLKLIDQRNVLTPPDWYPNAAPAASH